MHVSVLTDGSELPDEEDHAKIDTLYQHFVKSDKSIWTAIGNAVLGNAELADVLTELKQRKADILVSGPRIVEHKELLEVYLRVEGVVSCEALIEIIRDATTMQSTLRDGYINSRLFGLRKEVVVKMVGATMDEPDADYDALQSILHEMLLLVVEDPDLEAYRGQLAKLWRARGSKAKLDKIMAAVEPKMAALTDGDAGEPQHVEMPLYHRVHTAISAVEEQSVLTDEALAEVEPAMKAFVEKVCLQLESSNADGLDMNIKVASRLPDISTCIVSEAVRARVQNLICGFNFLKTHATLTAEASDTAVVMAADGFQLKRNQLVWKMQSLRKVLDQIKMFDLRTCLGSTLINSDISIDNVAGETNQAGERPTCIETCRIEGSHSRRQMESGSGHQAYLEGSKRPSGEDIWKLVARKRHFDVIGTPTRIFVFVNIAFE